MWKQGLELVNGHVMFVNVAHDVPECASTTCHNVTWLCANQCALCGVAAGVVLRVCVCVCVCVSLHGVLQEDDKHQNHCPWKCSSP